MVLGNLRSEKICIYEQQADETWAFVKTIFVTSTSDVLGQKEETKPVSSVIYIQFFNSVSCLLLLGITLSSEYCKYFLSLYFVIHFFPRGCYFCNIILK
jgi:hypothetical protein